MALSDEGFLALAALDQNHAKFNVRHRTARELMNAGFADDYFGSLMITELGRVHLRRSQYENFADLSQHVVPDPARYPMGVPKPPETIAVSQAALDAIDEVMLEELQEKEDTPVVLKWRQRALRAAGVASGKTGKWVDEAWITEFINALEAEGAIPD